jgi:hypothetical protein
VPLSLLCHTLSVSQWVAICRGQVTRDLGEPKDLPSMSLYRKGAFFSFVFQRPRESRECSGKGRCQLHIFVFRSSIYLYQCMQLRFKDFTANGRALTFTTPKSQKPGSKYLANSCGHHQRSAARAGASGNHGSSSISQGEGQ